MKFLSCLLLTVALLAGSGDSFGLKEYEELITFMAKSDVFQEDFEAHLNSLTSIEPNYFDYAHPAGSQFNCQVNSPFVPAKSVHALTPRDIKAVGAMGDSLTAALGAKAKSIIGLLFEYRGRSWSHGGDNTLDKVTTMPNILREFNPSLTGFSEGMDVALFNKQGVGLNVAVSGQEANHLLTQAKTLVERFKQSKSVNVETDWKMVTLFIGGNDLCDYCKDKSLHSPKAYVTYIQQALDLLKEQLPRTFVNLVMVLNVTSVSEMNRGLVCTTLHYRECPCVAFPKTDAERKEIQTFVQQYHSLTADLVASGRYDQTDDFTVVLQPFFKDFNVPRLADGSIDYSFFAPDCFHFSPKGHALAAVGLWNNMLQRVGEKSTTLDANAKINCPTPNSPYFFTNKNSRA